VLLGSEVEEAVPLLLATRDTRLLTELAPAAEPPVAAPAATTAPAEQLGCPICLEPYIAVHGVVPRMLVTCGHSFPSARPASARRLN
jgi:hypothetical protein